MAFFDPFHPEVGKKVLIPYLAYLIEHDQGTVLFDCGPHPEVAADPKARLGGTADTYEIEVGPDDLLLHQLTTAGVAPAEVTDIVVSHLHYDHAGGLSGFPGATVHIQRGELDFASQPPVYQEGDYVRADFAPPVRWHEVDGDLDLFGDGQLVIFATPGHTRGHQSMLVNLAGRAVILVGDAAPHARTLAERKLPAVLWNPDQMVSSWSRLEDFARDYDAQLIFPHDHRFRDVLRVGAAEVYR